MRKRATLACSVAMVALLAGACDSDAEPPKIDPTGSVNNPVALTFLAYGPQDEVEGMQSMVDTFNADNKTVKVTLEAAADSEDVLTAISSDDPPDVYLLSQRDIAQVAADAKNQPLDELLDSRGVDFSDLYKRDAIQAFSFDNHLQCMPYGVSPMVIYYNTALIDFDAMAEEGIEVPEIAEGEEHAGEWTLDQFAAAATWASTANGVKGVYIEPSLEGLSPFIYSGGGKLFDDAAKPTQLALSSEESRDALTRTLDVLRTDQLSPTRAEIEKKPALEMFKDGELAMVAGYRSLVPSLRNTESLNFDVMPMPTLDNETSVGDVSGLCMTADPVSESAAADFIAHAASAESIAEVAEAGYLVPANNEVAEGEAFLQPEQEPANAKVFNASIRDIVMPPLLSSMDELEEAVKPSIERLFYAPVLDLDTLTDRIDELSAPVVADLVIDEEEKVSPTPTP